MSKCMYTYINIRCFSGLPAHTSFYRAEALFSASCFCLVCGELWAPFDPLWAPRGLCLPCSSGHIGGPGMLNEANNIKLKAVLMHLLFFGAHWCSPKATWCDVAAKLSACPLFACHGGAMAHGPA